MRTLFLALLLTGCLAAPKDPNRLLGPTAMIGAQCASEPTHLARERCANPRIAALYAADGNDPADVAAAYFARREAIAERMDRGEISEAEGNAELAEARVAANAEAQRRRPRTTVCTTSAGLVVCQ